jgi:hypothetical protein
MQLIETIVQYGIAMARIIMHHVFLVCGRGDLLFGFVALWHSRNDSRIIPSVGFGLFRRVAVPPVRSTSIVVSRTTTDAAAGIIDIGDNPRFVLGVKNSLLAFGTRQRRPIIIKLAILHRHPRKGEFSMARRGFGLFFFWLFRQHLTHSPSR